MLPHPAALRLLKNVSKIGALSSTNLIHTSSVFHKKKKNKCGPKKIAVLLCGCGALDGTEISEAISTAVHLSGRGFLPNFYAPDVNVCATVNHLTKDPDDCNPPRNALVEGARIARSSIRPLCQCTPCENEALIIPGGFGVVRTMSDFAAKGCDCVILPDVEKVIKDFNSMCKPIGTMCISSVLVAKVLSGVKITLGKDCPCEQWPHAEAIEKVKQMGAKHELRDVRGVTLCKEHDVYSTPAWMDAQATFADVHEGIGKMINLMRKCIK